MLAVDGDHIPARAGEPVAVALAAAGRLTLGRSIKYHRPRGAFCYSGRCDGCLMRVDGVQSVMTCRSPARDGMTVETQNVVGSAERDLLAATDWFFPDGMNHHEMFTWNEQVNRVMQKVARRVAGVGQLPDEVRAVSKSEERETDVLVVGAGPAGLAVASRCVERGLRTVVVEEEAHAGGSLWWWPRGMRDRIAIPKTEVLLSHSAVAVYAPWESESGFGLPSPQPPPAAREGEKIVCVDSESALVRYRPRRLVIATGRNEGASAFEGADRPGVIGVRGACALLAHGVVPGERVVLAGEGPALDALAVALREAKVEIVGPFPERAITRARGKPSVEACDVGERRYECDAIVVAGPTSAVFELAAQAGAGVEWRADAYELVVGDDGSTAAPDTRVVGWAAGIDDLDEAIAHARRAADAIAKELAS